MAKVKPRKAWGIVYRGRLMLILSDLKSRMPLIPHRNERYVRVEIRIIEKEKRRGR